MDSNNSKLVNNLKCDIDKLKKYQLLIRKKLRKMKSNKKCKKSDILCNDGPPSMPCSNNALYVDLSNSNIYKCITLVFYTIKNYFLCVLFTRSS